MYKYYNIYILKKNHDYYCFILGGNMIKYDSTGFWAF